MRLFDQWFEYLELEKVNFDIEKGLNINSIPFNYRDVMLPFLFGKTSLTGKDLKFIEASINSIKIKNFYELYKNIYLDNESKILPVIRFWDNSESVEYIAVCENSNIKLKLLSIPFKKANDAVYVESLNRNHIRSLKNIDLMEIALLNNRKEITENQTLRLLFSSQLTESFLNQFNLKGLKIGKYMVGKDTILLTIMKSTFLWKPPGGLYKLESGNLRDISIALTDSDLSVENYDFDKMKKEFSKSIIKRGEKIEKSIF